MNAIRTNRLNSVAREQTRPAEKSFATVCLESCRKLISQLQKTKEAIMAEFGGRLQEHEHVLHLALNEAESLAWDSGFPHLVFPTLATEKAEEVAAWHARQQSLRQADWGRAFAA